MHILIMGMKQHENYFTFFKPHTFFFLKNYQLCDAIYIYTRNLLKKSKITNIFYGNFEKCIYKFNAKYTIVSPLITHNSYFK